MVDLLIRKGAHLNCSLNTGWTPLGLYQFVIASKFLLPVFFDFLFLTRFYYIFIDIAATNGKHQNQEKQFRCEGC